MADETPLITHREGRYLEPAELWRLPRFAEPYMRPVGLLRDGDIFGVRDGDGNAWGTEFIDGRTVLVRQPMWDRH